jgi:hypothetical protein
MLMNKFIISAIVLMIVSFNSEAGGVGVFEGRNAVCNLAQEKVSIKPEQLPKLILDVIQGDDFKGGEVISAFLITAPDKTQYYELNVKRGREIVKVKLDKDGKYVD